MLTTETLVHVIMISVEKDCSHDTIVFDTVIQRH